MSEIKNSDFTPTGDPSAAEAPADLTPFETSDLKDDSKETLGSYLTALAEENYYQPQEEVILSSEVTQALPGTPGYSEPVENTTFFRDVAAEAVAYFQTLSDGSTPDAIGGGSLGDISDLIDKTSQTDGHALLAKVVGDSWTEVFESQENSSDPGSDLRAKISPVLNYNRFQPGGDSPYIEDAAYSDGMFSLQTKVGRYDDEASAVALSEMAKIALSMMLTATGASTEQNDPDSADSTTAIGAGILNQLQLKKVDTVNLSVRQAAGNQQKGKRSPLTNTTVNQAGIKRKGAETDPLDAKNAKSYGVLNSYLEPFDGPLPVGMIVLAVIAAVAVLVAGIVLAAILTLIFLLFPPGQAEEPPEPMPMGSAAGQPDFGKFTIGKWLRRMLRIPTLKSGKIFLAAMFFGVLQFYWRITDALSSGYFIVVSRAAIRDLEQISDALADADFSNIVGGLESIFIVLDAFATSTTFQFLNTMAMLGDIVLLAGGLKGGGSWAFSPYPAGAKEFPDNTLPMVGNLHTKSRTQFGDTPDYRLAWRFGSLPSQYLLPSNILGAAAALGMHQAFVGPAQMPKGFDDSGNKTSKWGQDFAPAAGSAKPKAILQNGRFTAEKRQQLEDILESYYFPFYLTDMRTNEILALHSFVESISDTFAPQWSAVGGFGRMDDVMIYKNTKRSMGLSFYMVATNPQDQDELYFAINELVTMVYPQWSKGTRKKTADGKQTFLMPFSQVPTASPLVRLRLGDLWTSNYSLQNLARMFGAGTEAFKVDDKEWYGGAGDTEAAMQEKLPALLEAVDDAIAAIDEGEPSPESALLANVAVLAGSPLVPGVDKGYNINTKVAVTASKYRKCIGDAAQANFGKSGGSYKIPPDAPESSRTGTVVGYSITPIVSMESDSEEDKGASTRIKKKTRVRYAVHLDEPELKGGEGEADTCFLICGHGDLQPDVNQLVLDEINVVLGGAADDGGIPNPFAEPPEPKVLEASEKMQEFFGMGDANKGANSIVRAFNESGGKGIAGAITGLDFDWNLAPWDETIGKRAPTYVRVTMSFQPIHDIPLGLDAQGGIRAPAYPVGNVVRGLFGGAADLEALENAKERVRAAIALKVKDTAGAGSEPTPEPDTSDAP